MPEKIDKKADTTPNVEQVNLSDSDPAAPKKRRGRPKGSTNRNSNVGAIKEALTGYVGMVGTTLMMFPRTKFDGECILKGGEPLVDSLVELSKQDKRVRRVLTVMCTGGAWTGVVIASANIGIPIAANHGLLPSFMAGIFNPEIPEASDNGKEDVDVMPIFGMNT